MNANNVDLLAGVSVIDKIGYISSADLTCGTALGSSLLFLPHAIGTVGLNLPSLFATLAAYGYMTVSSLLTAELLINACGETGKVLNVGLLGLYHDYLGDWGGKAATVGFVGLVTS
eukprot:scaffold7802_cov71-Cyclotella_meneghiniana.AAC.20